MSLSTEEVNNIAHLARLAIDENDLPAYAKDLSNILDLAATMDSVDTGDIEPMAHPFDVVQRLRDDVVTETNQRVLMQKNAPLVEAGLYLVPKVIDEA